MPYCRYGHNHPTKEIAIDCDRVGHFKAALGYAREGALGKIRPQDLYLKFAQEWPGTSRSFYALLTDEEKSGVS